MSTPTKKPKTIAIDVIQKGFERVKKFNWQKCAEETLGVLKK